MAKRKKEEKETEDGDNRSDDCEAFCHKAVEKFLSNLYPSGHEGRVFWFKSERDIKERVGDDIHPDNLCGNEGQGKLK